MVLLHGLNGEETGVYCANATKLAVCHNRRIDRNLSMILRRSTSQFGLG
jgi:hypothetical protein